MTEQTTQNNGTKDISVRNMNGKTVLAPITALTQKNCDHLDTLSGLLIKKGLTEIILDLKQVTYFDSKALELMVDLQKKLIPVGGKLMLINLNDICKNTLICTRLINQFPIIK
jgi:anti-anti-sigma factor